MKHDELILVLEDDRLLNRLLRGELERMGYAAESAHSWAEAREALAGRQFDLIITDVNLPDANAMDLLPQLAKDYPVIVLTGFGTVQEAVAAMRAGAMEYLTKPVNPEELELEVKRALQGVALQREHQFCKRRLNSKRGGMVGDSAAMAELQGLIDAVAHTEATVLIQGESGVGKELVAHAIHERGPRAVHNFVAVDCCTLQEKLFESELFGHEKGAFTGADR